MNIALLVCGHIRTASKCIASQVNFLIDRLNPDIFVHTWDKNESPQKNKNYNETITDTPYSLLKGFRSQIIDSQLNSTILDHSKSKLNKSMLIGCMNMTFGFKRNFLQMKKYEEKNNIKYDYIIKIRPDILLKSNFPDNYIYSKEKIYFFGNKRPGYRNKNTLLLPKKDVTQAYHAMDIMSICPNNELAKYIYNLYDVFPKYYLRKEWDHTPYMDYVIDNNVDFSIIQDYIYEKNWVIQR